jgi:hypothetical protein
MLTVNKQLIKNRFKKFFLLIWLFGLAPFFEWSPDSIARITCGCVCLKKLFIILFHLTVMWTGLKLFIILNFYLFIAAITRKKRETVR